MEKLKDTMHRLRSITLTVLVCSSLFLLAACGPSVSSQAQTQQTATISKSFQTIATPIPTVPPYRCAAWSSNNAPGAYSTINVYARITKDIAPISGANATAVVHFQSGDQSLTAQAASDNGGYVTFQVQLQGQQPRGTPTTVDVSFSGIPGYNGTLRCTPAFFTPQ
nr:hypothetical protein [Ktedonobacteraceae bacterium]